jgi:uncharacterized membrane protein YhaH (DUF805 family)
MVAMLIGGHHGLNGSLASGDARGPCCEDRAAMDVIDYVIWFIWLYILFAVIALFIRVFVELFRDPDLSGGAKAGWTLLILVLPLVGVVIYLAVRGNKAKRVQSASHEAYLAETAAMKAKE